MVDDDDRGEREAGMEVNGFFRTTDPRLDEVGGRKLPVDWWSRPYEYAFSMKYANGVVADMGAGWMDRPFKDALAQKCDHVTAVDLDSRIMDLRAAQNVKFVCHDFTKPLGKKFDRIFCISVLEDLGDKLPDALKSFAADLKDDGLIVITMDVKYDPEKPSGKYPGVHLPNFTKSVYEAGLEYRGECDDNLDDLVHSDEFNLCCFHCVLCKK